jgi:hypothetical protein
MHMFHCFCYPCNELTCCLILGVCPEFLDAVDNSGRTPLWYCLAHKRWTMAEYLMTSGLRLSPQRAVPDFCVKRCFVLCRRDFHLHSTQAGQGHPEGTQEDEKERMARKSRDSLLLRNNSSQVTATRRSICSVSHYTFSVLNGKKLQVDIKNAAC